LKNPAELKLQKEINEIKTDTKVSSSNRWKKIHKQKFSAKTMCYRNTSN